MVIIVFILIVSIYTRVCIVNYIFCVSLYNIHSVLANTCYKFVTLAWGMDKHFCKMIITMIHLPTDSNMIYDI